MLSPYKDRPSKDLIDVYPKCEFLRGSVVWSVSEEKKHDDRQAPDWNFSRYSSTLSIRVHVYSSIEYHEYQKFKILYSELEYISTHAHNIITYWTISGSLVLSLSVIVTPYLETFLEWDWRMSTIDFICSIHILINARTRTQWNKNGCSFFISCAPSLPEMCALCKIRTAGIQGRPFPRCVPCSNLAAEL